MTKHRVRVFLSESNWTDVVFVCENSYAAENLGRGQSPIGRAIYLGELVE